jgi:hypothetical protein
MQRTPIAVGRQAEKVVDGVGGGSKVVAAVSCAILTVIGPWGAKEGSAGHARRGLMAAFGTETGTGPETGTGTGTETETETEAGIATGMAAGIG